MKAIVNRRACLWKPFWGQCFPPAAQNADNDRVGAAIENTGNRMAQARAKPQRPAEERGREQPVRPGIEPPLPLPNPHGVFAEGTQIKNRPKVFWRRPA